MNKEELEKEANVYANAIERKASKEIVQIAYIDAAEPREKRIAELEEKISVLLSCKKCPENKGGFICVKEYENKCLAQKVRYIKELQQENAELKALLNCSNCTELSEEECETCAENKTSV